MSTTGQRPDPARFLRQTEQQAREQQLEVVRLVNSGDTLLGLALLLPGLSPETVRELLTQANCLLNLPAAPNATANKTALSPKSALLALLQAEIDSHRESKLPCSLLLLDLAGGQTGPKPGHTQCQAISVIETILDHRDRVIPCDREVVAVLMADTSLGKARRRASAIQAALACSHQLLCCGLSVCHAHEPINAQELLQRTRRELDRATAIGNGALCHAALTTIDESCQVTVEERAQLFSFLD